MDSTHTHITKRKLYSIYMGTILFPWNRDSDCGVHNWDQDQLQQNVISLKQGHNDRKGHAREHLYCDAFHLQYLNKMFLAI